MAYTESQRANGFNIISVNASTWGIGNTSCGPAELQSNTDNDFYLKCTADVTLLVPISSELLAELCTSPDASGNIDCKLVINMVEAVVDGIAKLEPSSAGEEKGGVIVTHTVSVGVKDVYNPPSAVHVDNDDLTEGELQQLHAYYAYFGTILSTACILDCNSANLKIASHAVCLRTLLCANDVALQARRMVRRLVISPSMILMAWLEFTARQATP